jgi:hypothetical protein
MAQTGFSESYKEEANWKVYIQRRGWSDTVGVYLLCRQNGKGLLASVEKDGVLKFSEVKEGDPEKATLVLPAMLWGLLVDAITDTTPPLRKQVVDAELSATKYHLEDMRKIVFTPTPTPDELGGKK